VPNGKRLLPNATERAQSPGRAARERVDLTTVNALGRAGGGIVERAQLASERKKHSGRLSPLGHAKNL
jgi:hypothetical protein